MLARVRRGEPGPRRVEDGRAALRAPERVAQRRVRVLRAAEVPVPLERVEHDRARVRVEAGPGHPARRAARQRHAERRARDLGGRPPQRLRVGEGLDQHILARGLAREPLDRAALAPVASKAAASSQSRWRRNARAAAGVSGRARRQLRLSGRGTRSRSKLRSRTVSQYLFGCGDRPSSSAARPAGDIGGDSMTFGDATAFPKVTFNEGGGGGAAPDGRRTRSLGRGGVAGGFS